MNLPTFQYELPLWNAGHTYVAGVDEVGRGCFAGPVVAAAVILSKDFPLEHKLNDSKKLTAKRRKELDVVIRERALAYSISEISVPIINEVGIGRAAQQAFHKAVTSLDPLPEHILIDAFPITTISREQQTPIIRGDQISVTIAAASIIAKVFRDALMEKLSEKYAVYDFMTNKGYGTKKHREAIQIHGLSDLHRTSFNLTRYTQ
jgi:ribonuclease HII